MTVYLDTKLVAVWFAVSIVLCAGLINMYMAPKCKDIIEVTPCIVQQVAVKELAIAPPPIINNILCTQNTRMNPFTADEMKMAKQMRRDWTRVLPFQIEEMLTRNAVPESSEREFPLSHSRFDVLGPMTPACHELEAFGAGDGEKRACSLTKLIQSGHGDCTIISLGSNNE